MHEGNTLWKRGWRVACSSDEGKGSARLQIAYIPGMASPTLTHRRGVVWKLRCSSVVVARGPEVLRALRAANIVRWSSACCKDIVAEEKSEAPIQ